jgi:heme exporter protein CcmD
MTHAPYVFAGYAVTAAALAAYAGWIVARSRSLRRRLRS